MKVVYYTIAFLLAASQGDAGGLSNPIIPADPVPPQVQNSWAGGYAGLSFGQTSATINETREYSETTQDSEEVPVIDECAFDGGHSGGKKCTFDQGVDIHALFPGLQSCNRNYSETCDMGGNRVFIKGATGTTYAYDTGETTTVYGPEVVTYFSETVTSMVESGDVGAFAGYRWEMGAIVGVEAATDGTLSTLEASAGLPMGNVLGYAFVGAGQYDGASGGVYGLGADLAIGDDWLVGIKGTIGEFGDTETETVALRVGYRF